MVSKHKIKKFYGLTKSVRYVLEHKNLDQFSLLANNLPNDEANLIKNFNLISNKQREKALSLPLACTVHSLICN